MKWPYPGFRESSSSGEVIVGKNGAGGEEDEAGFCNRGGSRSCSDVVGVYLRPPQNAVVLCVDEKSQIQALDQTQPGLPIMRGSCGTMTHNYVRHSTTMLFAALNVAEGTVHGQRFRAGLSAYKACNGIVTQRTPVRCFRRAL